MVSSLSIYLIIYCTWKLGGIRIFSYLYHGIRALRKKYYNWWFATLPMLMSLFHAMIDRATLMVVPPTSMPLLTLMSRLLLVTSDSWLVHSSLQASAAKSSDHSWLFVWPSTQRRLASMTPCLHCSCPQTATLSRSDADLDDIVWYHLTTSFAWLQFCPPLLPTTLLPSSTIVTFVSARNRWLCFYPSANCVSTSMLSSRHDFNFVHLWLRLCPLSTPSMP